MKPGDRMNYRYSPRGGWGYTFSTPAVVEKIGPKLVTVTLQKASGETVRRRVKPASLSPTSLPEM